MGPAPDTLQPGTRFADRYEVESVLGRGAFGLTYLARDQFGRRRVVLKIFGSDDEQVTERVLAETSVSQTLSHPNVVKVLDSGTSEGRAYITSEWVDGQSLERVLQSGPLPVPQATAACGGIAAALAAAHAQGIIHRDLKPSNVLVPGWPDAPNFRDVRLLDFGVAGVLKPATQTTTAGMIFGTPVYMSPEQVLGEPQTTATDIYSLGLLLYEMLTGRKLREGTDTFALFRSILEDRVPPMPPSVPPQLARLIQDSLQRDPALRPKLDRFTTVLSLSSPGEFTRMFSAPMAAPPAPAPDQPATAASPGEFTRMFEPAKAQPPVPQSPAQGPADYTRVMAPPSRGVSAPAQTPGEFTRTFERPAQAVPVARAARRPVWAAISIGMALVAAVLLGILLLVRSPQPSSVFPAVFGGAFLMAFGIGAGFWIRGRLNRSTSELKSEALSLALDAKRRVDVTATIAVQLNDLVGRLRQIDQQILAGTVALMLEEYRTSSEGKDRQSALMNVVALSEKLGQRLSPWYVRYKDVIATFVAVAGAVSGLLTAYNGLRHH